MQEEKLSLIENKEKQMKKEKRKFSSVIDESTQAITCKTPKIFKSDLSSEGSVIADSTKFKTAKYLHYKKSSNFIKIAAKPESLTATPIIFQLSKPNDYEPNTSDCLLPKFLSMKSFNSDLKERFNQKIINKNRHEKEKKKVVKEKIAEKFTSQIKNKKEKKRKIKKQKRINNIGKLLLGKCGDPSKLECSLNKETKNLNRGVDIYNVGQNKNLIFHMQHPSKFSFHGEIKTTVIRGEVEILGFILNSSSTKNSTNVYSPNFCTPLIIETKPLDSSLHLEEVESKLKNYLREDDCNKLLTKLRREDSILLIEEIISDFGIVINKYFDKSLFPKDLEDVSSSSKTKTLKNLQSIFTFQLSREVKYLKKNPQWDKIPLSFCTVLCGGKGVGKSTLLKYYINKLVTMDEKVLCLDLDPGQPEFTFPGCISAVIVDQPLLGPNFTHVLDPVVLMSFGDVDVCPNPSRYLDCVKYVIESCRKNEELLKMKWFVNTMGFCKGLGVDLIITILKLLQPNTVIQIKSSDYKNNYPFYLTPSLLNTKRGFGPMPLDDVKLSHDLRLFHTSAEHKSKQLQGGLKRRQLRDIMCISYFSKMLSPPFYNFNAVQPYLISFSKLYLGIDFLINANDVLKAFNGNAVSLLNFEPDGEEIFSVESEDDYFKVVIKPKVAPALGIGFIRGIDCKENKFYIITHLPIEILENVNCLNLGRISPPQSMFIKQEAVEGQKVYTTPSTIDIIRSVKRTFRVPGILQKKGNNSL